MSSYDRIKTLLNDFLRGEFLKLALKKILGSAMAGGFRVWLVKFLATELYDLIGEPLIELVMRKGGYLYNKVDGRVKIRKLREAQNENDEDTYDDVVTSILS